MHKYSVPPNPQKRRKNPNRTRAVFRCVQGAHRSHKILCTVVGFWERRKSHWLRITQVGASHACTVNNRVWTFYKHTRLCHCEVSVRFYKRTLIAFYLNNRKRSPPECECRVTVLCGSIYHPAKEEEGKTTGPVKNTGELF